MIPLCYGEGSVTVYGESGGCIFLQPCDRHLKIEELTDENVRRLKDIFLELSSRKVAHFQIKKDAWMFHGNKLMIIDFDWAKILGSVEDSLRENTARFNQCIRIYAPQHAVDGQFRSLIEESAKKEVAKKLAKKSKKDAAKKVKNDSAKEDSAQKHGAQPPLAAASQASPLQKAPEPAPATTEPARATIEPARATTESAPAHRDGASNHRPLLRALSATEDRDDQSRASTLCLSMAGNDA